MVVQKKLKHAIFSWDRDNRVLEVGDEKAAVRLNKGEMFSLARFILRVAQMGKRKEAANETTDNRPDQA